MKDEHLMDAFTSWEGLSSSPDNLLAYRTRFKQVMDEKSTIREAKLREEAALEQGARDANEKTACNFLAMDMDIETVAKGTGLSLEEVKALKEKMKLS